MVNFSKLNKFFDDSVDKQWSITSGSIEITNSDLYAESIEFDESICSAETLTFGAEASKLAFTVNNNVADLLNKELTLSVTIDDETLVVGHYFVEEDKLNATKTYREVTAYDLIYRINAHNFSGWYKTKSRSGFFPCTVADFFDEFLAEVNRVFNTSIAIDRAIITNRSFMMESSLYKEGATLNDLYGSRILGDIATATASFIRINRSGNIDFVQLTSTMPIKTYTVSDYITCYNDDFVTHKISKVQILKEDGDIGAWSGTTGNTFSVIGNFVLSTSDNTSLQNACDSILNAVKDIQYTPYELEARANPCYECGDLIEFESHGNTYRSYIFTRTLRGIQAIRDTYNAEGTEEIYEDTNTMRNQVKILNGKSNVLKTDLDATISELKDLDASVNSRFEQTSSSITLQVSAETQRAMSVEEVLDGKYVSLQQQLDGEQKLYNTDYVPTLLNYPAWDFTYNIPCNDTVQLRDDLMFEYTDEYYNRNARSTVFNSADSTTYRFTKDAESGTWYWKPVADSDFGIVMQQLAELKVSVDGISSTVSRDYLKIVDAEGTYETIAHASSSITQTESLISAEVTRATESEGNLSSRITQTAESISSEVTRATESESLLSSSIQQTADSITAEVTRATEVEGQLSASLTVQADQISARVLKAGGNNHFFGWNLFDDRFSLYSGDAEVFRCNAQGIWVYGVATADELNTLSLTVNGKASIQDLESVSARIGTVEANYITANTVAANYATIDNLDVQTARINSLVTATTNANQGIITTGTVRCGTFQIFDGQSQSYKTYDRVGKIRIGNNDYYVVGSRT